MSFDYQRPAPRSSRSGLTILLLLGLLGVLVWRFWPHRDSGVDPTAIS